MKNIQLVIPMSGKGYRFLNAGYKDPKPLIEVDGMPMIEHVVKMFPGVTDILFICREEHIRETNMKNILKRIAPECKIKILNEEKLLGPVDTVCKVLDEISDTKEVIFSYCDYGTVWNFEKFLKDVKDKNLDGSVVCYTGFHPHMLGTDNYAFVKKENNLVAKIQEKKPFTDDKMSEEASNGTYYFKSGKIAKKYFKKLIDSGETVNGEFYISMVYNHLINDNLKVGTFLIEKMLQWGTPYDLEVYKSWSNYFANKKKQKIIQMPERTKLVLPMAGQGSRFRDVGYKTPKPLLPVDNKPMIIRAVDCLPQSKRNIFICLENHLKHIADKLHNAFENVSIKSITKTTEGQACTTEIGLEGCNLDEPFLVSACDNGILYDGDKFDKLLKEGNADVIVFSFRGNPTTKHNPNMYSWLDVEGNDIKSVSCKKFKGEDPLKEHAIIGTMYFKKAKYFLDNLKINYKEDIRTNGEFYVDDVIQTCIESNLMVKVFEVDNYICWGTPDDYETYCYWEDYFQVDSKPELVYNCSI